MRADSELVPSPALAGRKAQFYWPDDEGVCGVMPVRIRRAQTRHFFSHVVTVVTYCDSDSRDSWGRFLA